MEMSYSICMMKRLTTITTTAAAVATVFRRTTTASIFTPPSLLRRRSVAVHSQTLRHQCSSTSSSSGGVDEAQEKILVKGMRYDEFESWVTSQGYRPSQALMVWKLLYGNNSKSVWAHSCEELEGLNKDLTTMLSKFAKLKALQVKDIITATDGTRKDLLVNNKNIRRLQILFTLDDGLASFPSQHVFIYYNDSGSVPLTLSKEIVT
ncbi:dual-specificity RNA methyltransferase RlmN [Tanacetum coccineum]